MAHGGGGTQGSQDEGDLGRLAQAGSAEAQVFAVSVPAGTTILQAAHKLGGVQQWYDKSTFAHPTSVRFGTCPTNNLWGPGLINVDSGVSRPFHLFERMNLEARGQLFNTANTLGRIGRATRRRSRAISSVMLTALPTTRRAGRWAISPS